MSCSWAVPSHILELLTDALFSILLSPASSDPTQYYYRSASPSTVSNSHFLSSSAAISIAMGCENLIKRRQLQTEFPTSENLHRTQLAQRHKQTNPSASNKSQLDSGPNCCRFSYGTDWIYVTPSDLMRKAQNRFNLHV